jgi:hypothetical protein
MAEMSRTNSITEAQKRLGEFNKNRCLLGFHFVEGSDRSMLHNHVILKEIGFREFHHGFKLIIR